jgi:AraC family transcriptional regulator, arabinose operon regulatory protein
MELLMLPKRIEYQGTGHLAIDAGWRFKNHRHMSSHELIVVFRGDYQVQVGGRRIAAGQGDLLYFPKRVWHEEWVGGNGPAETYYVGWKGPTGDWDYLTHDADGRIHLLIQWLYQERLRTFRGADAWNDAHLRGILAELSRLTVQKEQGNLVREIRTYIQDHLTDPLTLDDLAEQGGVSKYHFIRKYRQLSGRTPMEDLRIIRVEAARNLILTTDLPLKAIAARVGLCDEYYLCRLATRYLKATLGSFRSISRPDGDGKKSTLGPLTVRSGRRT